MKDDNKGDYPKLTGKDLREIVKKSHPEIQGDPSIQQLYVYIDGDTQGEKFIFLN